MEWAVEEKADFIIGETFSDLGEAMLALQSIQQHGNGIICLHVVSGFFELLVCYLSRVRPSLSLLQSWMTVIVTITLLAMLLAYLTVRAIVV